MDRRSTSPGWGDGDKAIVAPGVFRVQIGLNSTHPHLPGDFVRRHRDGDYVILSWEKFDNLQSAAYSLLGYWKSCKPQSNDLDDYQIAELTKHMELLAKMLSRSQSGPSEEE